MSFKKFFERAIEVKKDESKKEFKKWYDETNQHLSEISNDRTLSEDGRLQQKKEVKTDRAFILLQKANRMKREYIDNLTKAKEEAEKVIEDLPKPDDQKMEKFNKQLKELKTELLLTPRPQEQERKLQDLIKELDEPYFAEVLREDFMDISETILENAGQDKPQYQQKLAGIFDDLKTRLLPEEAKEAVNVLEGAKKELENPKLFSEMPEDLFRERFREIGGQELERYLNETEKFEQDYEMEGTDIEKKYNSILERERFARTEREKAQRGNDTGGMITSRAEKFKSNSPRSI